MASTRTRSSSRRTGVRTCSPSRPHTFGPRRGALLEAGATLIAGHSAHLFHGLDRRVLYDLGDFLDDYAVDRRLRNDLGLLFLLDLDGDWLEAIPLKLEFAYTRLADGGDFAWVRRRFREACAAFGTEVAEEDDRLLFRWR